MASISSSPLSLMSFNVSSNFNRKHQPSKNRKPKHHKIACTSNDTNQNSPKEQEQKSSPRRNVLIGLGGLYGATTLTNNNSLAFGAPVPIPDLTKCVIPPDKSPVSINCCPPFSADIIDFKLPTFEKLRVRPAAQLVDDDYFAKYNKALELMRALPDDDPRSFTQQANIHCAYCVDGYVQLGYPNIKLSVHNCWLFLAFHRWYIYFYERILGSLINDPTFAIPFWNFDAPDGMQIPSIFTNPNSSLYDLRRDSRHQPPRIIDLNYNRYIEDDPTSEKYDPNYPPSAEQQIKDNLTLMHRQMITNSKTCLLFHGSPYRAGQLPDPGPGALESSPHNNVHIWSGDAKQTNREDMGNFYSSGRDPLFYALHGNVDRLWSIWKTLGGKRKDPTDDDWLESSFLFYDENKNLVKVKVKDGLDGKKLGYDYQKVDIPWINSKPKPASRRVQSKGKLLTPRKFVDKFPIVLDSVVSTIVKRPKKSRSSKEKEDEEEILVIDGIEFDSNIEVKFDVIVNDEDDKVIGVGNTEFAGTFVNLLHGHNHENNTKKKKNIVTCMRLGLTDLLEDLKADDDDSILVTFIPRYGGDGVKISGIKIEFAN
ncbi:polyphenol oxidase A1, chloroplastic-like [Trifolium pratense]|uniref:polyphenol oxidase A1, chloroplastic-like n=1 Tax=Trifolium pratense TaxID=57577 RepID=UPI001E691403|nr:polyphenol oxidase A1, chloroplastic-like [Trifolium pratense]